MPPRVVKMMTTQPGACAPDNHRGWISLASLTQHSQELGGGPVVLGHLQAMQHAGPPAGAVILSQPLRIRDVWRRGQVCTVDRSRLLLDDRVEDRLDIADAGGGGREAPDDPQGPWQRIWRLQWSEGDRPRR